MKKNYYLLMILVLCSCNVSADLSAEELSKYIADKRNGLTKDIGIDEYRVGVTYRPNDLLIFQEVGSLAVDSAAFNVLSKKYSNHAYFILSLSKSNNDVLHQMEASVRYSQLVQTMSFRMNEYVSLITASADTIPAADFMLNRTYGLSQSTDLLFVFEKTKASQSEWIDFNLNEFGLGIGDQRFRFASRDIEKTPRLKFRHTEM